MSNQLKPCPFCGSNDVEAFAQDEDDCPYRSAIVRCHSCDAQTAQMVGSTKIEMAIRAWNKRVLPSMTTDITELAQSHELRNKVNHRLYGALEFQGTSGENATITLSIDECKSIIAALDERLTLVEALEKAQQRIGELESKLANPVQLPKTNGYWTEQEKAYEEAITLAKRQIRVAGFRCEGDE